MEVGGYPTGGVIRHGREDWAFNIALGLAGWCGVKVERSGYLYRRHNGNRTNRNTDGDWRQRFLAQMAELYPDAYFRGKRPDMPGCCGGGGVTKKKQSPANIARTAQFAMDVQSMTLIEYVGRNHGSARWGGPGGAPSKRTYVFGKSERDRIRYVDNRDVKWLLGVMVEGAPVFRVYVPAKVEPVEPETKEIDPFDKDGNLLSGDTLLALKDPATLTIAEIKALDLTLEQWQLVLDGETEGRNRAGAIEFIKTKLADAQPA